VFKIVLEYSTKFLFKVKRIQKFQEVMFHQGHQAGFGQYGRFDRPLNFEALGKFGDLTPKVQRHLMQVYATLSSGLLAMALGVFLDYKFFISGTMTQILAFAMIVCLTFVAGPVASPWPECFPYRPSKSAVG
jgi:hypothetical protein